MPNYQKYRDLSISIIKKTNQHIINTAKNFIEAKLNIHVSEDPKIQIKQELLLKATDEYNINENNCNILLGIGGSGPTKRIPAKTFLKVIEKMIDKKIVIFFSNRKRQR